MKFVSISYIGMEHESHQITVEAFEIEDYMYQSLIQVWNWGENGALIPQNLEYQSLIQVWNAKKETPCMLPYDMYQSLIQVWNNNIQLSRTL